MSKTPKSKDPHAKREAENYANPIPSREYIIQLLEQIGEPIGHLALCEQMKLTGEEQIEALRRRLIAMSRDGQIISNRRGLFGLPAHMDLLKGRIQGNKDGYGFFIPEDGSGDMFLGTREMEKLFDGDEVLARHSGFDNRGRREGMVVEILKRRFEQIVGRYYREDGFGILVPDSKRVSHEIMIPDQHAGNAKDGQFVVAEITEYPSRRRKAIAKIVEVLGDSTTPGLEIEVAVRSHDIPHVWPSAVEKETNRFSEEVGEADLQGRADLRDIPFVTIDGEDAKDFDDAVFARRHQEGGWTLFVAIADVSHYVKIGSALDEEAIARATSVYFPGHVIPMLPEKLSNGLCSLKPKVDRLTMVCEMEISASGEMTDYSFYEAVIHSHARMTYNEVSDIVEPAQSDAQKSIQATIKKRHESLIEHFENLYSLFHALRAVRDSGGAMDFDTTETRIVFGEDRKIREIVPVYRNDAHRLIEECMLCANVAAARLLEDSKLPALYRVHEGPNPDKLENLRMFLKELDLHLPGGDKPEPADYQYVLKQMAGRPDRILLQTMLIRSLMQAVYQPENLGHFGLGYEAYAHFTSPIRRYPDLLVHRAIRYLVRNKPGPHVKKHSGAADLAKKVIYPFDLKDMIELGEICSTSERRADAASYSVIDALKCEYMQDRVGDEFVGTVTSVTSFGLFVELNEIYVEGLVHISELSNDYYHFDPVHHSLSGERSQKTYRLGDSVEVKVVRVDLNDKKIDLQMIGLKQSSKKFGKSKAKHTDSKKAQSKKEKYAKKKTDSAKKPKSSKKSKHKKRQANSESKSRKGTTTATKTPGKKASAVSGKPKKKPSARRRKKPNAKPQA
ncbi:MAG: ribonuclease R [SAR86 cluster bacterium]|uniref:Ribonuclease R n=1 Tax=SAR86 cluster bacterium TaxID=2030880 RepID=A0A2A4XAD2_9GAMM|nr:MAG: ribonuclease R [SAR86 cluster bacterium]